MSLLARQTIFRSIFRQASLFVPPASLRVVTHAHTNSNQKASPTGLEEGRDKHKDSLQPAMKRKRNEDIMTRTSKNMSRILRHKPPPGMMDAAGWVSLPVLLQHLKQQPTEELVRQIVASCEKKRFVLDDSTSPPRIRAAQGHSVELAEAVLQPVTEAGEVPVAVHVTSATSWEVIQQSGELLRMKRSHVHFAAAPHHLRKNKWAEVYLRLDLQAALAQGLLFFLSSNGVLLCEGPVPVSLVRQVELADLPQQWHRGGGEEDHAAQGAGGAPAGAAAGLVGAATAAAVADMPAQAAGSGV